MRWILYLLGVANGNTKSIERIHEQKSGVTLHFMGLTVLLTFLSALIVGYLYFKYSNPINRPILSLNPKNGEIYDLITLDYPQQSYKNLQKWVNDAVIDLNALSFSKLQEDLDKNRKYFIDDKAFNLYVSALEEKKILKTIQDNNIIMTAVTLKDPVLIKNYGQNDTAFWLFRVPVLVYYMTGSNNNLTEKYMIDILIYRVPSHKNHKGLAISMIRIAQ